MGIRGAPIVPARSSLCVTTRLNGAAIRASTIFGVVRAAAKGFVPTLNFAMKGVGLSAGSYCAGHGADEIYCRYILPPHHYVWDTSPLPGGDYETWKQKWDAYLRAYNAGKDTGEFRAQSRARRAELTHRSRVVKSEAQWAQEVQWHSRHTRRSRNATWMKNGYEAVVAEGPRHGHFRRS